jgi:hypothetical protein
MHEYFLAVMIFPCSTFSVDMKKFRNLGENERHCVCVNQLQRLYLKNTIYLMYLHFKLRLRVHSDFRSHSRKFICPFDRVQKCIHINILKSFAHSAGFVHVFLCIKLFQIPINFHIRRVIWGRSEVVHFWSISQMFLIRQQ